MTGVHIKIQMNPSSGENTRCCHSGSLVFSYKNEAGSANAALKCSALRRLKMALGTGARGAVLYDAQPILEAGALTQARTGDQAGQDESAAETCITTQDLVRRWARCSFQKNPHPSIRLFIRSLLP